MPNDDSGERGRERYFYTLANVGLEMVAPMLLGLAIDVYLGWTPLFTVIGLIAGFVGGVAHLIVLANKQDQSGQKRKSAGDKPP